MPNPTPTARRVDAAQREHPDAWSDYVAGRIGYRTFWRIAYGQGAAINGSIISELGARKREELAGKRSRPHAEPPMEPVEGAPHPAFSNKKRREVSFYDFIEHCEGSKDFQLLCSQSQDHARYEIQTTEPVAVVVLSDLHMGSRGTDYKRLAQITREVLAVPNLYVILAGDLVQMAILGRSVMEDSDNLLTPEQQHVMLGEWLEIIGPRVIAATWDNHGVEREEKRAGASTCKALLASKFIYFSGIGHLDLAVGAETYRVMVTHKVRGRSMYNPVHGQMRYGKWEGQDREILIAGDSHVPGITEYTDGPTTKLAMNCGALQVDSGFGKRYFSLYTHPSFPVLMLWPDRHTFIGYSSLEKYLLMRGLTPDAQALKVKRPAA